MTTRVLGLSRGTLVALAFAMGGFFVATPAYAATTWVVDPATATSTIGAAVAAAQSGDTIQIAAGTYNEQVVITTDNLTLTGSGTITASTSPAISIQNASTTISGLTINDSDTGNGISIVDNDNAARTVTISGVTVNNYATDGVAGQGNNLTVSVDHSIITAAASGNSARHGIYVHDGATANLTNNTTTNNECASCSDSPGVGTGATNAAGIWLYNTSGTSVVNNNKITTNQYGIIVRDAGAAGAQVTMSNNSLSNAVDGLYSDISLDASQNYWGSSWGPTIASNKNGSVLHGDQNPRGDAIEGSGSVSYRPWCTTFNINTLTCGTVDASAVTLNSAALTRTGDSKLAVDLVFNKSTMNQYINFNSSTIGVTGLGSGTTTVTGSWAANNEWQGSTDVISASVLDGNQAHLAVYGGEDTSGNQYAGNANAATAGTDTQGPTITQPSDITKEATGPSGAAVTFSLPTASDPSGVANESCNPASGSTFALGQTTVTCTATDTVGNTSTTTFMVTVQSTSAPTITVTGGTSVSLPVGTAYVEQGATAHDVVDGDITGSIQTIGSVGTTTVGTYTITYSVTNSQNISSSATRMVHVVDETPPTITLLGDNPMTVAKGGTYTEPGATASDNYNGDITANIVIHVDGVLSGTIDTSTIGDHSVSYDVQDSSGNSAITAHRTVHVVAVTHTITASAGSNGSIAPSGGVTVNDGNGQIFAITPDAHYHVVDVTVDGVSQGAITSHTFTNVTADHTISATFAPDTYTLTYAAGSNGSLTGTASQSVAYGANGSAVTAVPFDGYYFTGWSGSDSSSANPRTDTNVQSDISVTANFGAQVATAVTVTCPAGHETYDGTAHDVCIASVSGGDLNSQPLTVSYDNNINAGTVTASANYAGDAAHAASSNSATFIIDKATPTATLSVTNSPVVYDGTAQSATVSVTTSSVAGAVANVSTGGAATQTNAGTYAVTADFVPTDTANYNTLSSLPVGNFVIGQATSVTTVSCPATAVYTGLPLTPCTVSVSGASLNLSPTPDYVNNTSVGPAASASYSYAGDPNHTGSTGSQTFTVNAAPLIITASDGSMTYGGSAPTITPLYTGFVNNETSNSLTVQPTCSVSGTVSSCSGATSPNYAITYVSGTVTVNPATASVVVTPYTTTYDGQAHTATAVATGVTNEDLSSDVVLTGTTHTTAGTYTDTWTFHDPAGNYADQSGTVTDSISSKDINVTVDSHTKVYGNADPALTYTNDPLASGDSFSGALTRAAGENVGSYAITQGTLALSSNYNLIFHGANLAITPAALTISAQTDTKPYDGTADSSAQPTVSTLVGTDSATVLTQTFDSANAGSRTLVVSGYTVNDGNGGNNYSVTTVTAAGTITKATPTATLATTNSATYDGAAHSAAVTVSASSVPGSVANVSTGGAATQTNAGSYAVTASFVPTDSANYSTLTGLAAGSFTISPKTLVVEADSKSKTYGGTNPALTYTHGSLAAGDTDAVFSGALARTSGESAGAYEIDQGTLSAGGNYTIVYTSANLLISKANATVSVTGYSGAYDGAAHGATGTATGVHNEDLGSLLHLGSSFVTVPGGTAHWTFDGNANYNPASGDVNIAITQKTPTAAITVTNSPLEYDATAHAAAVATTSASVPGTLANVKTGGAATQTGVGSYAVTADFVPTDSTDYSTLTGLTAQHNFIIRDTTPPTLTLSGSATTSLLVGNTYTEPGYTSVDLLDGPITADVQVSGTVNTATPGTYTLTYTSTDAHGNTATATRQVVVSATGLSTTPTTNGDGTKTGVLTNAQSQSSSVSGITVTLSMPANLAITGPSGWDGTLAAPSVSTSAVTPSDASRVLDSIEIGVPDVELTFDKPVELTFVGQGGDAVGWSRSGVFHAITSQCSSETNPALGPGEDCKYNGGAGLIVWTRHFSTFTVYQQTASSGGGGGGGNGPVSGGGGGGGGGGPIGPIAYQAPAPAPAKPAGVVLGAAAYNFAHDFHIYAAGQDVTELQKVLIADGYLIVKKPTSYFGPATKVAVQKYQKAHGIKPTNGSVGPLTRAALNKGS
jgi:hypothetical protein